MQFAVIGLNHNTAPVDLREKLSVSDESYERSYRSLLNNLRIHETVILSTCNRIEYYLVCPDDFNVEDILYRVAIALGIGAQLLRKHSYIYLNRAALIHICAVSCGVDSMVLGEPQIFGQVKDAFRLARKYGGLKIYLNRIEQFVINTAKKVRTDTGISKNPVSISYAAVSLAKKIFGDLKGRHALIIGAGEMCELACEHLIGSGVSNIIVINRTQSKAVALARRFHGKAAFFNQLQESLVSADIVISSTGAKNYLVKKQDIISIIKERGRRPLFFIDIAVPRDIDPLVSSINNVYLYDIDDLKNIITENIKEREDKADKALSLINGRVRYFEKRLETIKLDPIIKQLKERTQDIIKNEIISYCNKNKNIEKEDLEKLLYSFSKKLLHNPLTMLKQIATQEEKHNIENTFIKLFKIDNEKI